MCLKVGVLFCRVKKLSRSLCRKISCLAGGHPLHRLIIHSSVVSLSRFRMWTHWYRVGSSNCRLNNIPLVPKLRLPLQRRKVVRFPRFICDFAPTYHGWVGAAVFLHALTIVCVLLPSACTTFEVFLYCFFGNGVPHLDLLE